MISSKSSTRTRCPSQFRMVVKRATSAHVRCVLVRVRARVQVLLIRLPPIWLPGCTVQSRRASDLENPRRHSMTSDTDALCAKLTCTHMALTKVDSTTRNESRTCYLPTCRQYRARAASPRPDLGMRGWTAAPHQESPSAASREAFCRRGARRRNQACARRSVLNAIDTQHRQMHIPAPVSCALVTPRIVGA
jgi:hypothetical protein